MNAKVIVVSYGFDREVRTGSVFPNHNQSLKTREDYERMWNFILTKEMETEAGCDMDTLIVVNGGDGGFWKQHNGKNTKNGKLIVKYRENSGGSFGAYTFAFQNTNYAYYLFTEDDLIVSGDNYFSEIKKKLVDNVGFVCLVGANLHGGHPAHCHGGVGLTSRKVLSGVKCLPCEGSWDKERIIIEGEIPFTNEIVKLGYDIVSFGEARWTKDNFVYPFYNYDNEMKINIGCGRDLLEGYINADISPHVGADEVFDVKKGIPFNSDVFDEVRANNILTQIADSEDFVNVMNELWRVTKGDIYIRVPNAKDICAWQDPMDNRRFTDQTFTYMEYGHRRYKQYGQHYGFKPFVVELLEDNGRQMTFKLTPKK